MDAHTEQTADESQYVTVKDVAKIMGCSDDTVRRMITDKDLVAVKWRGMYRIERASFQTYLEKHRIQVNGNHKESQ